MVEVIKPPDWLYVGAKVAAWHHAGYSGIAVTRHTVQRFTATKVVTVADGRSSQEVMWALNGRFALRREREGELVPLDSPMVRRGDLYALRSGARYQVSELMRAWGHGQYDDSKALEAYHLLGDTIMKINEITKALKETS